MEEKESESRISIGRKDEDKILPRQGPIMFDWESYQPLTGDDWNTQKQNILARLDDDEKLKIIGRYFSAEKNNSTHSDLGFARSQNIKDQLFPELADDRVEIASRVAAQQEGVRDNPFSAVDFEYPLFKATVKEIDGKAFVWFGYNQTNRIRDDDVETYLDDLVNYLKSRDDRVKITGHTCNRGDVASNEQLGRWRAEVVKDFLVGKGINSNRILTESMGQRSPLVPNINEANRKQNRRAEIELIN